MLQGFELLLCSGYLSLMTFDNQDVEVFLPQIKLHTVEPANAVTSIRRSPL